MRITVVTGAGGAGVTTTAAALALASPRWATLLLPLTGGWDLERIVGAAVSHEWSPLGANTWVVRPDPSGSLGSGALAEWLVRIARNQGGHPMAGLSLGALPLTNEFAALLALDGAEAAGFEHVVIDAGPVEPFLRVLALLEAVEPVMERAGGEGSSGERWGRVLLRRVADLPLPDDDALADARRLLARLAAVHALLRAPAPPALVVVVTGDGRGEAMLRHFAPAFALLGIMPSAVVVRSNSEFAALTADALRRDGLDAVVVDLPRMTEDVVGAERLRSLGEQLVHAGLSPSAGVSGAAPEVVPEGAGYCLRVPLPLASAAAIGVVQTGEAVEVRVAEWRRWFTLGAGWRVEAARFADGCLHVPLVPE